MCKFLSKYLFSSYLTTKREKSVNTSLSIDSRWRSYRGLAVAMLSGLLISSFSLNSFAGINNPGKGHDRYQYGKYNNKGNHYGRGSSMEPIVIKDMQKRCAALLNDKLPKPGLSVNVAEVRDVGLPTEHCFVSFTFKLPGGQTVFKGNHFFPKTFSKRFIHLGGGGFWPGLFDDIHSDPARLAPLSAGMAVGSFGGDIYNDLTWVTFDHNSEAGRAMARDGVYYSTVIAKALLKDFYGISPRYSYFSACSRGGQQGVEQALYHPDAFDGIAVGAPAFMSQILSGLAPRYKDGVLNDGPNYPLYNGDLGVKVANAIKHQCDGQDGSADNVISNPSLCHPDFASIFADLGLTSQEQRLVLDSFVSHSYTGTPLNSNYGAVTVNEFGYPVTMPTYPEVSNLIFVDSWSTLDPNADPASNGDWGAVVFGHLLGFDFTSQAFANTIADLAVSPADGLFFGDLNAFSRQGGKLVIVHTWPDSVLPITHTIGWVAKQNDLFKSQKNKPLSDTMRFFTADSGDHCGFDLAETLNATMDWVEKGKAPETLRVSTVNYPFDRPACQYPKVPVRKNPNANILDYNSYSCLTPEQAASSVTPVASVGATTVADGIAVYNNQASSTFNGHEYKYVNLGVVNNALKLMRFSWADSRSICQGLGAGWDLATIHSQAENDFITNTVMGDNSYFGYLGGAYDDVSNKWYWIDDPGHTQPFWIGFDNEGNVNTGVHANGTPCTPYDSTCVFANWNSSLITSNANNNEPNRYNGSGASDPERYVFIEGNGEIPSWALSGYWADTGNANNLASPVCERLAP